MTTIQNKKLFTLVFALKPEEKKILLGLKKRGFGKDKFNGFGGKVEPGETILAAAYRELEEEAMIKAEEMEKVGVNLFTFENDPMALEVHVYKFTRFTGEPTETEEMRPEWFDYKDIPYEQMWADDKYWLESMFNNQPFLGEYHFAQDQKTILYENLIIMETVPLEFDLNKRTMK
ncbi:unnamed protein product [Cunninghamella blakesleeana]